MKRRPAPAAICPMTGVTIPECSCKRCIEEQIRNHSPTLLDRRFARSSKLLTQRQRHDHKRAA